jgi:N4-(beta-N-acetylglucosaminyl)-L-asparaginase
MTGQGLPIFVGSWNAGPAAARACERARAGAGLLDAIVAGIELIEDDPAEMSVGYGGLPNEEGVVELDAAVMDGAMHKAGAVAGLRGVRHAAAVALQVMRRTDHALIVGEGALKFARQMGFKEEDLLTPEAREAWLAWKANLSTRDAWLGDSDRLPGAAGAFGAAWAGHISNTTPGRPPDAANIAANDPANLALRTNASSGPSKVPFTQGTVHLSGIDARGDLAAVTSTSGLSYKLPGRAGDTPMIGGGLYVDNDFGAAGCTGRGEASLQSCAAYEAVRMMEEGRSPAEAARESLRRLARRTREPRLLAPDGGPVFNVTVYALRKDGAVGSAAIRPGYTFVACRGGVPTLEQCVALMGPSNG